ncbi:MULTISPECIES: LysR substrate-binding domain-containing protein [unclassified Rhizobium]|uniref:LysR substrate-binding domain-containing protein n=1 Tax=unclassified Rhizobium TaxID=2613769 RepID=UPI000BA854DA|nr:MULTISPECIES: LysR substrate-binding domain-containing protein [unclassified Rhizobium]ASW08952.1 LysR family transcriptional regulator [Rhizobium sp. 11515TR]MDK4712353.1 LysR substrate-binding domain-containing protein [Rhizobium sp. CNPSo 4039]
MSSPLPSLNALKAFEATARHRSMTLAADELCVTHGAISRHIRGLEETLGVILVTRRAHSTEPTPEGSRLAEGLASAFGLMQASVERVRPSPLTLSCSSSIMMGWIIPRIGQFHERHPHIALQFNMNYDQVDFVRDKISLAIRSSVIDPPKDAIIRELGGEAIGPVCSPEYLNRSGISRPDDMEHAAILSTQTRPQAWSDWQAIAGQTDLRLTPQAAFDHFYLLIQAAACGLGMAVVPQMLVLDQLASGRLVAPFGFLPGPRRMVLWIAPHIAGRPDALALERWLTAEMHARPDT